MMNQAERIEAMERLPEHLGEIVTVLYVDQMNQQRSIRGILKKVNPYTDVFVAHLERVPKEMQGIGIFQGKIMKNITGIPFLGSPSAIMSIAANDRSVLYDNDNVRPFYNPFYFPNPDEEGRLRTGIEDEIAEAEIQMARQISFGDRYLNQLRP
ncbi:MAG: hypothetical protein Q8R04_01655 [Nanoarchaeota archaeon]|nr:hypothetical protein [Nanoarchaeota archaeon]